MLRACPHHGFTELTQVDTFYNGLNDNDQDSLNAAAGGNLLSKTTRETLNIIENKSKVRYSRNKPNASRMNTTSRESISKTDERIDKLADQLSTLVAIVLRKVVTPAPVKAVEETCVTCGGAHSWYNFPTTDNNQASVCATTGTYNQVAHPNRICSYDLNCHDKEKLLELAKIPLNKNCSAMLLKKLPEKLRDPGKFLIPCNFLGMDVCHALADLGASINLMPLSFWKKLSLPELTPTQMTLELADRSITHPKGLAEDVYVKVGKFHFPTDFVVVDFEADPRVPLILGRSFLRTGRALIDVYGEEITLRVDNEAVTFNLDQTTRYSSTNDKSVNRIDIIDAVCEEYAPELLGFSNNDSSGGNPTPTSEPFTSEFILEEIKAYLKDDSISPEIDYADCDPEEDIFTKEKSSIEEPPELELKDLPSHLEYAYLEENNKLPVIIAKGLKDDEKEALLKDDYKHTVQSQRRVNPKIHEVIKKEVLKLLDAGMIYPISDSPWVSPVHCVPKKGGITVVANEENELIPTRYLQIPIDPQDQEKTTFTCPYGTFAYRRMPFGLCNAPGTFQRCMMAIFHDMIEKTMEVFMDDFSVFGDSFDSCLSNLEKMLKRCEDTNLVLNWEKCHFMCREGIVLGHKISKSGN
ncbi:reverse transcriptase domain-containing protein [Tanacetum coccineum]|uniref:Reverse transcriptase domain-containing protein n=1 Tax=Tanacetum coccineum TaxID=301880 RepID=A0ABQ5FC34_9ASTR